MGETEAAEHGRGHGARDSVSLAHYRILSIAGPAPAVMSLHSLEPVIRGQQAGNSTGSLEQNLPIRPAHAPVGDLVIWDNRCTMHRR